MNAGLASKILTIFCVHMFTNVHEEYKAYKVLSYHSGHGKRPIIECERQLATGWCACCKY